MEFVIKTFDRLTGAEVYEIVRARQEIFLMEQNIICRDFDGVDYDALHCFLWDGGRVVAYLRAFVDSNGEVRMGRFLSLRHGEGLGKRLMQEALPVVSERLGGNILIHAQKHAEGFYRQFGFRTVGEEFLEEGIEHVVMRNQE